MSFWPTFSHIRGLTCSGVPCSPCSLAVWPSPGRAILLKWFSHCMLWKRRCVRVSPASQNALSWVGPTGIIESSSYVNGPYGDRTHSLGVLSTMPWPTELISENWQEMHIHPKFLKGEVAVDSGNVEATENQGREIKLRSLPDCLLQVSQMCRTCCILVPSLDLRHQIFVSVAGPSHR